MECEGEEVNGSGGGGGGGGGDDDGGWAAIMVEDCIALARGR